MITNQTYSRSTIPSTNVLLTAAEPFTMELTQ